MRGLDRSGVSDRTGECEGWKKSVVRMEDKPFDG